jgi:hypothetical protein
MPTQGTLEDNHANFWSRSRNILRLRVATTDTGIHINDRMIENAMKTIAACATFMRFTDHFFIEN